MPTKGLIIVVSAPSGAGKSTLCAMLEKKTASVRCSISCTTRAPRPGEKDKRDYFFVTERRFKDMIKRKQLLEWALVHGQYYGTPRHFLESTVRSGKDIVLNIDVQGGLSVRRMYPEAVLVFVMTPTFKELEKRLRRRRQDSDAEIDKRLANATKELKFLPRYDYLVINDSLTQAVKDIETIINAEHSKLKNIPKPVFR